MILSKTVRTKITNQGKYYASLGYRNTNQGCVIEVLIKHLKLKSNIKVLCKCDDCFTEFSRQYQLVSNKNLHRCFSCDRINIGRMMDMTNTIKATKLRSGMNHPCWNPNKSEFRAYASKVRIISEEAYKTNINAINPNDHRRTLCGTDGGYQLDHIISIKFGFDNGLDPSTIGNLNNLQMLPWKENRSKWI